MAVTLSDLQTGLRTKIKTDQSGKIWGNSELTDLANAAQLQIQADGQFNWPANQGTSSTQALTGGTREYALPSLFGRMDLVMLSTTKLYEISFEDAIVRNPSSAQSTPSNYYIRGANIGFDPVPGSGTVTMYYRTILTALASGSDAISFPDSFKNAYLEYMAYLAWSGLRGNEGTAAGHLANFEREINRLRTSYLLRDMANLNYRVQRYANSAYGVYPYRADVLY